MRCARSCGAVFCSPRRGSREAPTRRATHDATWNARGNDATRMPNRRSPFEREIARDADARARLRARSWRSSCRDATDAKQPRPSPASVSGARADDDLPLSPPDMTVRPSRPPPPSPPSSRRSRSSARPPSPASLPPPCSPRCVLDSTTISPAGASDRPYPRARDPTRGANGDQLCAETPSDVSSSRVSSPGRAHAPAAPLARAFPRARRAVSTSHWLVARRGTAVQFCPAARRPVPRPTVRASLTRRYPPSFPSSSSPVRERRHLRRVPGPHLPPGEGHRPCQHLPRRRDWRVRL